MFANGLSPSELPVRIEVGSNSAIFDSAFSDLIAADQVSIRLRSEPYLVPEAYAARAKAFLDAKLVGRKMFNGALLGVELVDLAANEVTLVPGGYFDHLATDLAFANETLEPAQNWRFQAVGVSALALSADQRLIALVQSAANESSHNLLAPAGSGSLEPQDVSAGVRLRQVLATGALRELSEEAGLQSQHVAKASFLGCARWVEKGDKPEFFYLAQLNISAAEVLALRPAEEEAAYRSGIRALALQPQKNWSPALPSSVVGAAYADKLSLPLATGLSLLAHRREDVL